MKILLQHRCRMNRKKIQYFKIFNSCSRKCKSVQRMLIIKEKYFPNVDVVLRMPLCICYKSYNFLLYLTKIKKELLNM
jgi:hypothetical protein